MSESPEPKPVSAEPAPAPAPVPAAAPAPAPQVPSPGALTAPTAPAPPAPTTPATTPAAPPVAAGTATASGSAGSAPPAEGTASKGGTQPGVVADSTAAKAVADSVDVVEPEGPESDERLWAAAVWVAVAATLFLPPIPLFTAPMVIRRLRERASEFVSAHAANAVHFAMYATVSQAFYVLIVVLAALSAQSHWRAVIFPALAVYIFVAAGVVVWLGLVGHNAWKGRRNRPVEFRKLILYR